MAGYKRFYLYRSGGEVEKIFDVFKTQCYDILVDFSFEGRTTMEKTISSKMGIKEYDRTYFHSAPDDFIGMMKSLKLNVSKDLSGEFDYIHLFVMTETQLKNSILELKPYISKRGSLWISWPKSNQLNTNLNLLKIIKIVYQNGLVESKVISMNDIWSAIKITHPIEGKIYKNSYGILNRDS